MPSREHPATVRRASRGTAKGCVRARSHAPLEQALAPLRNGRLDSDVKFAMRIQLTAAAAILAAAVVSAQDPARSGSLERPFVADGRVNMDLSAGDYRIISSPDNRVRLDWSVRDAD